jgi:copper chaperone CopZ
MTMIKKIIIVMLVFTAVSKASVARSVALDTDSTITIKVKGITCSNDLKTLSDNVKELKGVSECKPGKMGPISVFKISFNPALVSTKEIYKAIENTGGCSDPDERPYKVKLN